MLVRLQPVLLECLDEYIAETALKTGNPPMSRPEAMRQVMIDRFWF